MMLNIGLFSFMIEYGILSKNIHFSSDLCYPSLLLLSEVVRIERYHRLNIKDWNDLKEISPFVITIDIAQSFEFMLRMVHSRHIDMMTYLLQLNKYSALDSDSSNI